MQPQPVMNSYWFCLLSLSLTSSCACPPGLHTNSSHRLTTAVNQHPHTGTPPPVLLFPKLYCPPAQQTDKRGRAPPHTLTVPSPVLGWGCKWLVWLRLSCISRGPLSLIAPRCQLESWRTKRRRRRRSKQSGQSPPPPRRLARLTLRGGKGCGSDATEKRWRMLSHDAPGW